MTEKNRAKVERKARRKPPMPPAKMTKTKREKEKQIERKERAKGWDK